MLVPLLYYFCIVFWIPRTFREKLQYTLGCCIYVTCGPFINIIVLLYAVYNVDSFGWGKTRRVVSVVNAETNAVIVPVPVDEEKEVGLRQPRPKLSKKDKVAILGCNTYSQQLLKAFGTHYRTIAYDPDEEVAARIRQQFSGTENYTIQTASDEEQLATANIYLIAAPAARPGRNDSNDSNSHITRLTEAIKTVTRHIKPGDIVMIESTVSVGTTRSLLTDLERRGAICGFSPAPFAPTARNFSSATKTISALNPTSLLPLETIYRPVFPSTTTIPSPEIAEFFNLLCTAQRHSQTLLSANLLKSESSQQTADQLYTELKKISAMWKEFVIEAENGLELLSPPQLSFSQKTTPGQRTPPTPSRVGDPPEDDVLEDRTESSPPHWGTQLALNGCSVAAPAVAATATVAYERVGLNMLSKPMPQKVARRSAHGHANGHANGNDHAGSSVNHAWIPRFSEGMV
jgi:hypothetical protein